MCMLMFIEQTDAHFRNNTCYITSDDMFTIHAAVAAAAVATNLFSLNV